MPVFGWADIMQHPDFTSTVQRIQAQLGREFRAVPSASPELRQAADATGSRLSRLQDVGGQVDLAGQRLNLKGEELALERRDLNRYARRLPLANLVGVGNLALSGLGAYANIRAIGRSEARGQELTSLQAAKSAAEAERVRLIQQQNLQLADLHRGFLSGRPEPFYP